MPSSQTSLPSLVFTLSRSQADLTERSLPSWALHPAGSAPETFPFARPMGCCEIQKRG